MIHEEKQLLDCLPAWYRRLLHTAICYSLPGPRWAPFQVRKLPLCLLVQYAEMRYFFLRMGYGAQPHVSAAIRRAGYPRGQTKAVHEHFSQGTTGNLPTNAPVPWQGLPIATDAGSRVDKHILAPEATPLR